MNVEIHSNEEIQLDVRLGSNCVRLGISNYLLSQLHYLYLHFVCGRSVLVLEAEGERGTELANPAG